ncbi:phosphoribosyltransferase family protein [Pseudomonas sp. N040]|uniref:phosphoribosyltransferase family protein n=1 Tax=Pseudomonas sp. N040 TaxID=2785325 RepID=UPI0018A30A36|nr:phosphoribosyltransferase family protein [Pseudomonas sp. N040]MBF7731657.1 phosphoribosyltransferase [Pseudomonas sp. N040]MBW7015301.1 phosphoribosyltransferase [Pseudomonas sp. N040]
MPEQRFCLYNNQELQAVLDAMAREAALLLPADALLVGILRRGEPLARMLQQRLARLSGAAELPLYSLKVKRYADDLTLVHGNTALTDNPELAQLNLADKTLLVVDDVLYHGHSLLRTCAYLAHLGAREVRTAVLVDRCIGKQPIHADIVGLRLQVAPGDVIECNVPPYEEHFRVEVLRRS